MKCSVCGGSIDVKSVVPIKTGCYSSEDGYQCGDCGRVHWTSGKPTYDRRDQAFFIVDGQFTFISKDEENDFAIKRKEASAVT